MRLKCDNGNVFRRMALTGGIGSGKSTVAGLLALQQQAHLGLYPLFCLDQTAAALAANGAADAGVHLKMLQGPVHLQLDLDLAGKGEVAVLELKDRRFEGENAAAAAVLDLVEDQDGGRLV